MTRRFLLSLLIFVFIALVVLPNFAFAAEEISWWDRFLGFFTDPLSAITRLVANVTAIAVLIFSGVAPVLGIAAGITYGLMTGLVLIAAGVFAVIRPVIEATLSIPVIPGQGVDVVTQGWAFSRDIVSMFFIAILVFIGLATILRLQTYQAQKTLPLLIIMALLINFSGVIVGFVVDMANLITFAFIKPIAVTDIITGPLTAVGLELWEAIEQIPTGLFEDDPLTFFMDTFLSPVLGAAVRAIFYLIFIIVLLLVLFLFIIRVGALWILTILAPFAFAAYILPATRGWWSQWWQQLFQWAFMSVPMAFFLLLSMKIANIPQITEAINQEVTGVAAWFGNILIEFIQPLFVLLFLIVGLLFSITFTPKGVQFVTSAAQRGFKAAGIEAAKRGWEPIPPAAQTARRRMEMFYHEARATGLGEAIKQRWRQRPPIIPTRGQIRAATRGTWEAARDSASAGWRAATKAKKKKAGFECPQCKHKQSQDRDFCENCGFAF